MPFVVDQRSVSFTSYRFVSLMHREGSEKKGTTVSFPYPRRAKIIIQSRVGAEHRSALMSTFRTTHVGVFVSRVLVFQLLALPGNSLRRFLYGFVLLLTNHWA